MRSWYAGLARSTSATPTRQAYALVRTILNTAVDDEILLRNPCRIRGAGVARTAERPIATLAQVEALAEAVHPRYRALVLLAAWTGARWGELIALTRDRVDLSAGQMRIDRQYVLLKAEGDQPARVVLQSPKTEAGRRIVHIPPHLLPVLAAHLLEHVPPGCELGVSQRQGRAAPPRVLHDRLAPCQGAGRTAGVPLPRLRDRLRRPLTRPRPPLIRLAMREQPALVRPVATAGSLDAEARRFARTSAAQQLRQADRSPTARMQVRHEHQKPVQDQA